MPRGKLWICTRWDVHRHRVAPEIDQVLEDARREGQLTVTAGRVRSLAGSGNGAAGHQAVARTVGLDAPIAGAIGARVDPENLHASEASISFSEMLKFDDTFCTSS